MKTIYIPAVATLFFAAYIMICQGRPVPDNYEQTCLANRHLPPYLNLTHSKPVSGVAHLGKRDLGTLYTAMLELKISVNFLKSRLSCRAGENVPRPYHHCFLVERSESDFLYNSTQLILHRQRLAMDQCLLTDFVTPIQNAISYERDNHMGQYVNDMDRIRENFDAVLRAMSNITSVALPTEEPDEETDSNEEMSRTSFTSSRNTRQTNNNDEEEPSTAEKPNITFNDANWPNQDQQATTAPAPPTTNTRPGDASDHSLFDQNKDRSRRNAEVDQPPTTGAAAQERCSFPQNDEDQYIYIYEFYLALWYVVSDLMKMR